MIKLSKKQRKALRAGNNNAVHPRKIQEHRRRISNITAKNLRSSEDDFHFLQIRRKLLWSYKW